MTNPSLRSLGHFIAAFFFLLLLCRDLRAQSASTTPASGSSSETTSGPEEADIKKVKQKYWTRGNEADVGVVQNRIFTKRKKWELGVHYDTIYGDPFLSTKALTASAGYYFDELRSAHLIFSKIFVSPSSALNTLQQQVGTTANTNEPNYYIAGEARASLLYGKVSLLGATILHFDAYLTGGFGMISTESGNDLLLLGGIGQLLHITRTFGISLAYKLLWYRERILGKVGGTNGNLGQYLGTRSNFSSVMMVGVSFLLDPTPEDKTSGDKLPSISTP